MRVPRPPPRPISARSGLSVKASLSILPAIDLTYDRSDVDGVRRSASSLLVMKPEFKSSDYHRIAKAIEFIVDRMGSQPTLPEIAAHLHLSPYHFQRMFCRWAGVTPKRFLQVLTVERAKALLRRAKSVLEVSDAIGLSSASRLHDHFVRLEAVTPGEYKTGGAGMAIDYGIHRGPFGSVFIAATPRGICRLSFLAHSGRNAQLTDLYRLWPHATLREDPSRTHGLIETLFNKDGKTDSPLSLHVSGTNFQINVWKALMQIPPGSVMSYGDVARVIGHPNSARAVGLAVGANPVAFLIPCHRVIRQCGMLGGYQWGETRKHAILAWEAARSEA